VGVQYNAAAVLPQGKTQYPLFRRLGGPQGRSGRVRKISSSQGFDPRTVRPVASRYTGPKQINRTEGNLPDTRSSFQRS